MDQDIYELLEIPKERHLSRRNSSGKHLGNDRVKELSRGKNIAIIALSLAFIAYFVYSNIRFNKLEESITYKENTIAQLNQTISSQKQQLSDMVSYVNGLESRNRQLAAYNSQLYSSNSQMSSAANSAKRHLDQAEFWAQSGDEFFTRHHYNEAKRDLGGASDWP